MERHRQHAKASALAESMAKAESDQLTLNQRIDYLVRAVHSASQACENGGHFSVDKLSELQDDLEVAGMFISYYFHIIMFSRNIYEFLLVVTTSTNILFETRAISISGIQQQLLHALTTELGSLRGLQSPPVHTSSMSTALVDASDASRKALTLLEDTVRSLQTNFMTITELYNKVRKSL